MNITDFTNIQERHGPLLAFRRETFARDISTAEAAELLLQSAQALQLTDRQSLYGNTLNDWLTGGKPPAWAIQGRFIGWNTTAGIPASILTRATPIPPNPQPAILRGGHTPRLSSTAISRRR
ncbi:hypothetical protein IBG34_23715 (plasmid) [Aeromonas media]|nr:hypothetical protein IBG34_23715 [Aeromonas media]